MMKSSGDAGLDRVALRIVTQAKFPPPPAPLIKKYRNFTIPVCGDGKSSAAAKQN